MTAGAARILVAAACLLAACTSSSATNPPGRSGPTAASPRTAAAASAGPSTERQSQRRWRPAHIVVVVEENHSYGDIIASPYAPYMNSLARHGAVLTNSFAVAHPSEPNYLALFSGSTQGLAGDGCPLHYRSRNLATQLQAAGRSFAGYAETLPHTGSLTCFAGNYARRHAPWTNFAGVPRSVGKPFGAFPTAYRHLPDVSFVIPNLAHDMHDGTVGQADRWLRRHLGRYVTWARQHDSLVILTWDEDDRSAGNHIATLVVGSHVRPGHYPTHADHYRLLRTIEWLSGLPGIHRSRHREPLTQLFAR